MKALFLATILLISSNSIAAISNLEAAEFALGHDEVKEMIDYRSTESRDSAEYMDFSRHKGIVRVNVYFPDCMLVATVSENKDRALNLDYVHTDCE